jgi:hypothetical protein
MDALFKKKKVIPVYFPAYMTEILQSLDRSCFDQAKNLLRRQIFKKIAAGLKPTKAQFLET